MSSAEAEEVTRWIFEWARDLSGCGGNGVLVGVGRWLWEGFTNQRSGRKAREGKGTYGNTELLSQGVHFGVFE